MSKLDKATNRARARDNARKNGGELPPELDDDDQGGEQSTALAIDHTAFHGEMTTVADRIASGEWEAEPQIFDLAEGVTYEVFLEGPGPAAEVADPRTKEMKLVGTWIMRSLKMSGLRVSVLTSAQLDRKLPPHVGGPIAITKLGKLDTSSGRRVTDFHVAAPKKRPAQVVETKAHG